MCAHRDGPDAQARPMCRRSGVERALLGPEDEHGSVVSKGLSKVVPLGCDRLHFFGLPFCRISPTPSGTPGSLHPR
jgi:hypothetical protein